MALPNFMLIQSNANHKYLRHVNDDKQRNGFISASGEDVLSPYMKFGVEPAKCGNGRVHIKSCFNNKYWAKRAQNQEWIVAEADESEEDQSKWSCTLFEPEVQGGGGGNTTTIVFKFRHVQSGYYAYLQRATDSYDNCLFVGSATPDDRCNVFTIIDMASLWTFPKHVAFKYKKNGDYLAVLKAHISKPETQLCFTPKKIKKDIANEVQTTLDGNVHIKSVPYQKYWRRGNESWIVADQDDTTKSSDDMLFSPTRVDKNVVALRNLGNKKFCTKHSYGDGTDRLQAALSGISDEAYLEVEEIVTKRNIDNINFRLMDARIYNLNVVPMATRYYKNDNSNPTTVDLELLYTETKSSTWNSSVSVKLFDTTTIRTGVPSIAVGKIKISDEITKEYKWGETESSNIPGVRTYAITVPPNTEVIVRLQAQKGSCDIPFSYSQSDTLTDAKQITNNSMEDGVYTGTNYFNFHYVVDQKKIMMCEIL